MFRFAERKSGETAPWPWMISVSVVGCDVAAFTVKIAALLVALPPEFVTTQE